MRRLSLIIFALVLAFSVSGCSYETRVDKASIAETVTVQKSENGFVYSFFILSTDEEPKFVSIEGSNFDHACIMARQKYIPDLSLTKLELFVVSEDVYSQTLYDDVRFMATQYYISPRTYVAIADSETMNFISESKDATEKIKKYIILNKNKNKETNENLLSIFNNFAHNKKLDLNISYINSDNELKVSPIKILFEK